MNIMIKEAGVLMMLAGVAMNGPAVVNQDKPAEPVTLESAIAAANSGEPQQPDPLVNTITSLCPVVLQAARGMNDPHAAKMEAACAMLQSASTQTPSADDLLAMVE